MPVQPAADPFIHALSGTSGAPRPMPHRLPAQAQAPLLHDAVVDRQPDRAGQATATDGATDR